MVYVSALWIGFDLLIAVRSQMTKVLTKKEFVVWSLAALVVAGVSIYSDRQDAALMTSLKQGEDTIVAILSKKTDVPASEGGEAVAKAAAAKIDRLSEQVAKLEKRSEWRTIDTPTGDRIIAALKAAGKHKVWVFTIAGNREAIRYAERIVAILRCGNWDVPGNQPMEGVYFQSLTPGLFFEANPKGPILDSLDLLAEIFAENHIPFERNGTHPVLAPDPRLPLDTVGISVSTNPNAEP
jgi:hypothetical protein